MLLLRMLLGFVAATITPQHLVLNRNFLFQGGLQPHNYCLKVLKRETHIQAIMSAVTSGCKRFFLGTDSATDERRQKRMFQLKRLVHLTSQKPLQALMDPTSMGFQVTHRKSN